MKFGGLRVWVNLQFSAVLGSRANLQGTDFYQTCLINRFRKAQNKGSFVQSKLSAFGQLSRFGVCKLTI
jgi:hypothetical protein